MQKNAYEFSSIRRVTNYQQGNWWDFHLYIIAVRWISYSNLKLFLLSSYLKIINNIIFNLKVESTTDKH